MFVHTAAEAEIAQLDNHDSSDIADIVAEARDRLPSGADTEKIHAPACETAIYRFRAGDIRIFYTSHRTRIIVLGVSLRKTAYDDSYRDTLETRADEFSPERLPGPPANNTTGERHSLA
jgi:mRNA-degrading endonuclease RelE of RelBE toxin-antitoxin system